MPKRAPRFIFDSWLGNSSLKFVLQVVHCHYEGAFKEVSEGRPITRQNNLATTFRVHLPVIPHAEFAITNSRRASLSKRWCPLWFGHFLQTPSSFKNANYLDWSDIWKMFLQPKELEDTAMGLDYSERHPCSLTVWQRWNEAAGLSIFICGDLVDFVWNISKPFSLEMLFHGSSLWLLRSVTKKLVIAFFQQNHQQRSKSLPGITFDVCIFQTRKTPQCCTRISSWWCFSHTFCLTSKGKLWSQGSACDWEGIMVLWLPACLSNNYKGLVLWYVY